MAEQIPFSIAEHLLMELGSVAFEEIGLMYGVREELAKLQQKLSMIKDVILDAEEQQLKSEQARSRAIAGWIRRLKDVVYDADDLLDDFATEDLRRKTDVQGSCGGQVRDFFSSSNHLAFRYKMGHRIKDIRERLDDIANDMSKFNFTPRVITDDVPRVENKPRETHSFEIASDMIGRGENEKQITELLMQSSNEENVSVVAIVGIGGLGKTSLAQLAYNNDSLVNHFELKMWVCVSDDFRVKLLVGNIIKSATKQETKDLSLDELQHQIRTILNGKRYLLVLDDVWNEDPEKWNELRKLLMNGGSGSKILVTTRSFKVALAMGVDSPYVLEGLKEDDSWLLFEKLAFKQGQEQIFQNLVSIGREIVKRCKGVPLVIRVLASALRSQSREDQWLSIKNNENLMALDDGKILSVLKLSYDALPVPLKQCFTYCALFPKDYEIEKDMLIQLWMAQGYIQGDSQFLENLGEQYFEEFLRRSFFQVLETEDDGSRYSCKMHDLIHDLAQSIVDLEVSISTDVSNDITERVRHISVITVMDNWEFLKGKSVRTFLLCAQSRDSYPGRINIRFPYLRVLDLNGLEIGKVPKCVSKLRHLRYLDLSYNSFDKLPNFIIRLQNLQTLKLWGCYRLQELPKDIRKLVNLRHLVIEECESLTHMPSGLGQLTKLQSLSLFVVGEGSGDPRHKAIGKLCELKPLNNLRGRLEIRNLENVMDSALQSKEAILKEKQCLQSLTLCWEDDIEANRGEDDRLVMEGLQPHPNLKELYMEGYGGVTFPTWMTNDGLNLLLPNLVRIEIRDCERCRDLPLLDQLPSLKDLELEHMSEVEYMKESSATMPFFPSLETLIINEFVNWKGWWRRGLSFPCLSDLDICGCPKLTSFGESSFPCLKELSLVNVSKELLLQPTLILFSLKNLYIGAINDLISLPKGLQHVTTLETLQIESCSAFDALPDWIATFTSLTSLELISCPQLKSLPEAMSSMSTLQKIKIASCPYLAERCQKVTGEDWPKISHIPSVDIFQ